MDQMSARVVSPTYASVERGDAEMSNDVSYLETNGRAMASAPRCPGCSYARELESQIARMERACGHSVSSIASSEEGTNYCRGCELDGTVKEMIGEAANLLQILGCSKAPQWLSEEHRIGWETALEQLGSAPCVENLRMSVARAQALCGSGVGR